MPLTPLDVLTRRLAVLGAAGGLATGVILVLLRQWHRAAEISQALDLLTALSGLGVLLSLLMAKGPVHHWIMGSRPQRRRLKFYCLGGILAVFAAAALAPVQMPTPLVLFVFLGFFATSSVALIATEGRAKWRPLFFVGSVLVIFAVLQFSAQIRLLKRIDWPNASPTKILKSVAGTFFDAADSVGSSLLMALDFDLLPKKTKIGTIQLRVAPGSLEAMAANLPQSAKEKFYRGYMLYPDGQWRRIQYRMRGRSFWHWMPEKPSLRIKLRKANPLGLQRHINLVNPEDRAMVANVLGEEIARGMGVLTHRSDFVRLFVNNKYFGVYHRTTREDQEMLRLNRRIPGPLFIGEFLGDPWKKEDFEVAGRPDILEKVNPLGQMIEAIYEKPSIDRYEKFWGAISFEKLARWDAAMKVVGGFHSDSGHNHLYYFDPRLGRLEPVVTDVNGHGMLLYPRWLDRHFKPYVPDFRLPLNERLQPIMDTALRDPRFVHRRNEILYRALNGVGSAKAQEKLIASYYARIDGDVRADRQKGAIEPVAIGFFRQPFSNRQFDEAKANLVAWIRQRNEFLKEELDRAEVQVTVAPRQNGKGSLFLVAVTGNGSVRMEGLPGTASPLADKNLNGGFVATQDSDLVLHPGLIEDRDFVYPFVGSGNDRFSLRAGTQRYLFATPVTTADELAGWLKGAFSLALGGQRLDPLVKIVASIDPAAVDYNRVSFHPWLFPKQETGDIVLGPGNVTLNESLFIGPKQRLRILPGTAVKMGPGVSIISRGPVKIEGTADAPVHIGRADPEKAWGGLLIYGEPTKGSRIRHARITGGSAAFADNIAALGMVSVYGSRDFLLENSTLGGNVVSDDTLHIVYGNATLVRNRFEDCFSDCVDFDYVRGRVEGMVIRNAGNDGIDFMDSTVLLSDVRIEGAGDKGLSVGELSRVTVSDARISGAATAIAVKDASRLTLEEGELSANGIGIDIFKKNWRYGGPGRAKVSRTRFDGNEVDLRVEENGVITLGPGAEPRTVVNNGTVERSP